MKTGIVLKSMFVFLCMGALVSCGSDNKDGGGNVVSPAPAPGPVVAPVTTNVNLSGEGIIRRANSLADVRTNIRDGHFAKIKWQKQYVQPVAYSYNYTYNNNFSNGSEYEEILAAYKEIDYSCSVNVKESSWWIFDYNRYSQDCSDNGDSYFDRNELSSGAVRSGGYGSSKIEILENLYRIANESTSANVYQNMDGSTIAQLVKGNRTYTIDFSKPIFANPVKELEYDGNGRTTGYYMYRLLAK